MKKIIIALLLVLGTSHLAAQQKYSVSARLGTGISVSTPSAAPFTAEVLGHYHLNPHWAVGAGTGYGLYDNVSTIPLFANAKYTLNPSAAYNFFADCSAGYGFALGSDKNGGFYLNPAIGVQHQFWNNMFSFSVGYQLQNLERLKSHSNEYVSSQFEESLIFSSISLKLGITF
ncbi:MAG: hypothetical protein E6772_07435 [Dysgonomonas sp.]|nr:hypothetical protein [Dysgonomonas sp.]